MEHNEPISDNRKWMKLEFVSVAWAELLNFKGYSSDIPQFWKFWKLYAKSIHSQHRNISQLLTKIVRTSDCFFDVQRFCFFQVICTRLQPWMVTRLKDHSNTNATQCSNQLLQSIKTYLKYGIYCIYIDLRIAPSSLLPFSDNSHLLSSIDWGIPCSHLNFEKNNMKQTHLRHIFCTCRTSPEYTNARPTLQGNWQQIPQLSQLLKLRSDHKSSKIIQNPCLQQSTWRTFPFGDSIQSRQRCFCYILAMTCVPKSSKTMQQITKASETW